MDSAARDLCDGLVGRLCSEDYIDASQSITLTLSKSRKIVFSKGLNCVHSPEESHYAERQRLYKVRVSRKSQYICKECRDMRRSYGYRTGHGVTYHTVAGPAVDPVEEEGYAYSSCTSSFFSYHLQFACFFYFIPSLRPNIFRLNCRLFFFQGMCA